MLTNQKYILHFIKYKIYYRKACPVFVTGLLSKATAQTEG